MELLLITLTTVLALLNLLVGVGMGEQILKPFSMYLTSRGMDKLHPHYERVKAGFEALDNTLMQDNNLIAFMFEASDYVWSKVIPSIAKDLSTEDQSFIADYLVDKFDGDTFANKVALLKNVVNKEINT